MVGHFALTALEASVVLMATLGVLALLLGSLGVLRLKGAHQRMHAASVGTSAGLTLLLVSAGTHYWRSDELWRMLLLVLFFFVTSPIATTAMARAGYRLRGYRARRFFVYDDLASPDYLPDYAITGAEGAIDSADAAPSANQESLNDSPI